MRRPRRYAMQCYLPLTFFGEDFVAIVDFRVTVPCRAATYDDPPESPEWETDSIVLAQDFPGYLGSPWKTTGAQFRHLDEALADRVAEYICNNYAEPYYD